MEGRGVITGESECIQPKVRQWRGEGRQDSAAPGNIDPSGRGLGCRTPGCGDLA